VPHKREVHKDAKMIAMRRKRKKKVMMDMDLMMETLDFN
jgi:hypothetical protein